MATVEQVAKSALRRILVQGAELDLEPGEYQDFMDAMNHYMLDLNAQGIALGYTEVSNLADQVTVPTGALRGVITNMAIEVAPEYGGVVSDALVAAASDSLAAMRRLGFRIKSSRLPGTLPIGSGNKGFSSLHREFYPDEEASILAETTGAIGLESDTLKGV